MPSFPTVPDYLGRTLFDADLMLKQRRNGREVLKYLNQRLRVLNNPPKYLHLVWDQPGTLFRGNLSVEVNFLDDVEFLHRQFCEGLKLQMGEGDSFEKEEE